MMRLRASRAVLLSSLVLVLTTVPFVRGVGPAEPIRHRVTIQTIHKSDGGSERAATPAGATLFVNTCPSWQERERRREFRRLTGATAGGIVSDPALRKKGAFRTSGASVSGTNSLLRIPRGGNRIRHYRGGGPGPGGLLKRHPFASAVAITTCNAVLADLLTQFLIEPRTDTWAWNRARTTLFAAFGFSFQGCAQYCVVNLGWERAFPGTKGKAVLSKMCGMNFVSDPLLFFPTFYAFKEVLNAGGLAAAAAAPAGTLRLAMRAYGGNCWQDWRNSWLVWFPGHAVTYGLMRPHQRIPWMAFLSFFYMCVLSITRGASLP